MTELSTKKENERGSISGRLRDRLACEGKKPPARVFFVLMRRVLLYVFVFFFALIISYREEWPGVQHMSCHAFINI